MPLFLSCDLAEQEARLFLLKEASLTSLQASKTHYV
jgi:hypothetical protein